MNEYIELFKKHNLLKIIDTPLDIDLEIPHLAFVEIKKPDSKVLLFTNPISKKLNKKFTTPVLMNTFCSFEATRLIFGKEPNEIANELRDFLHLKSPKGFKEKISFFSKLLSLKNVPPKTLKTRGICQEVIFQKDEINLYDLPILTTWSKDGGPFITMGQVYTTSLDGVKRNLGMYRLQVYDKNRLGMHWQIHKDAAGFFSEYKKANKKMPVSVAIGGDPLYIWCGQAPLPEGVFELLLYGFVRGKNAKLVKSITNDIEIPHDVDFVIEGFVDPNISEIEGPFGDHTGFYTPMEPYPVMDVVCITSKKEPIYQATVVGKPPLEDKYMGYGTERIFLPLLQTTAPDLIDYHMPENGVFHNLILAKIQPKYEGHAKQVMHAFWGVGQMSFVKHAIFVDEKAPKLEDYENITDYILNRTCLENILISEGVCDALDHASPNACYGGKLGIDCTKEMNEKPVKNILQDDELFNKMKNLIPEIEEIKQYKTHTKTPICVIGIKKVRKIKEVFEELKILNDNMKLLVFVDINGNDVKNPYMLIWRIVNNIDSKRDIFLNDEFIGIDATNKSHIDNYLRSWPEDVDCDNEIINLLYNKELINIKREFLKKYYV